MLGNICEVGVVGNGHAPHPGGLTGCSSVFLDRQPWLGVDVQDASPGTCQASALSAIDDTNYSRALFIGDSNFARAATRYELRFLWKQSGTASWVGRGSSLPGSVIYGPTIGFSRSRREHAMAYKSGSEAASSKCDGGNVGIRVTVCCDRPHLVGGKT